MALSSNGLGRDPLKVEIRVRFPLRLLPSAWTPFFDSSGFKRIVLKNPTRIFCVPIVSSSSPRLSAKISQYLLYLRFY